jgi:hypothetical protein
MKSNYIDKYSTNRSNYSSYNDVSYKGNYTVSNYNSTNENFKRRSFVEKEAFKSNSIIVTTEKSSFSTVSLITGNEGIKDSSNEINSEVNMKIINNNTVSTSNSKNNSNSNNNKNKNFLSNKSVINHHKLTETELSKIKVLDKLLLLVQNLPASLNNSNVSF